MLEQKHSEPAATPANQLQSAGGKVVIPPDVKKSSKPPVNRQSSQDSQNSGRYM